MFAQLNTPLIVRSLQYGDDDELMQNMMEKERKKLV